MGACDGPQACLDASAQVNFDDRLGKTSSRAVSLAPSRFGKAEHNLRPTDEMAAHARSFYSGNLFPLFLGGARILPPPIHAARHHPAVEGDLENLTIVHSMLTPTFAFAGWRDFSHACAASRSL